MTIIRMEIRMEGIPEGCKEVIAMELEESLKKIAWAEVRCTGVEEVQPEQLRMDGAGRGRA